MIRGNTARSAAGINNSGSLSLTDVMIVDNRAQDTAGALWSDIPGDAILTNVTISNNYAGNSVGGIYNISTLTMTGVTLSGNEAKFGAGATANTGSASINMRRG